MVAAELRDVPYVEAIQALVVRNYGPSIAMNVQLTFDPPIPDTEDPSRVTPFLNMRYERPIPVMTPGMELDNIYWSGEPGSGGEWVNTEPTPAQVAVTITYESTEGDRYEDRFPLDTNLIRKRTYATSSTSPEAQAKEMVKALKGIQKALSSASRHRPQGGT